MSAKRFRIAFSFAGEKRDFVARVANILAKCFGEAEILYDKYHQAEFSRSDLAFYLPDLYEKESDLVVAVFCPDYETKEWCGLEWNAIFGLLKKRNVNEVMLTRFERVEGKGLHGIEGYTDLDDLSPEQAADLILERLAINEGRPRDHYKTSQKDSGEPLRASIDFREALRIASAVGYAEGVATYTGNLATLALDREDWPGAETLAREALTLSEQVGRQELIGANCNRIAIALVRQEKRDEAMPYSRRAVEIYTRLGHPEL